MTFKLIPAPGNKKFFVSVSNLERAGKRSVRHGFFDLGKSLKSTASKNILKRPKGGRTYIIRSGGGRRRRHVASAPGETHANLSGRLRRSLGWKVRGSSDMEFGYGVDKDAPEYAPWVEEGTSVMAARPSLKIAVEGVDRNAVTFFKRRFKDEVS